MLRNLKSCFFLVPQARHPQLFQILPRLPVVYLRLLNTQAGHRISQPMFYPVDQRKFLLSDRPSPSSIQDIELFQNDLCQRRRNLPVPWDRCLAANGRIDINIMPAAMPGQDAASLLKLLY